MIAKKIANPRKGAPKAVRIRLLADYVRNPETESATEKCVYAGALGFLTNAPAAQTAEMIALAEGAVRSRDPITHFVFSWALGEHPTDQQVEECVDILEDEMELRGHQIIYGLHVDTKNSHLHVVVNRVIDDEETGQYRVHEINRGFDIEAAHRVGARIEAAQGWSVEANKRYRVREDGSLERTMVSKERPQSPGQRELDAERRTGTKSASRIAIEQAAPVIANACSWAELHDGLAAIGMRYEKKGSGAVVLVNSIPVKASRVARPAALKQLEKRLGVFVAPQNAQRGPGTAPAQHAKNGASDPAEAVPLIKAASSWAELHASLAEHGMRYEKVGGGAAITVGGTRHKASSVARQTMLKHLEERIGIFVAPQNAQQDTNPTDAVPLIQTASSWAELHASLAEHGMRYEKVGSGAAITVGGTRHKASSVARQVMLKHSEERIGIFVAPQNAQQDADPTDAVPLIQAASSWAELHASLAEHGMRYEKVGSGAAITVGGTRHKASSVARQASLGKLQKRLGRFRPAMASPDKQLPDREAEPLDGNAKSWQEYRRAREAHNAARDAARLALDREWDRRFEEFRQRKKADRDALTRHSWKGRGTELNAMRSALAREHAAQIARLRQERGAALRQIRREYPPWPSYDEWLSNVERWWQEQTRARLFLQAQGKAVTSGLLRPVHGYTPELIGSRVHYAKPPRTKAAFVDLGRSIAMCGHKHDDDDLLAAMILAARKWDEFVASGDRNFFDASIRLAALHDLPLANPELQDDLERERARHRPQSEPDVPKRPHPTPAETAPKTSHSSIRR